MAKKVARLLLTLAGAAVGVGLVALANRVITFPEGLTLYQRMLPWGLALVFVGSGTIIAIIFNLLFAEPLTAAISYAEAGMSAMPAGQLIYCVCGLIAGLVVAGGALQACVGSSGHRRNTVHRLRIPWVERHEQAEGAVPHTRRGWPRQGSRLGTAQASGYLRHNRRTHRGNM